MRSGDCGVPIGRRGRRPVHNITTVFSRVDIMLSAKYAGPLEPSGKQFAVASQASQSKFIARLNIDQEQVRLEMALPAPGVSTF